MVVPTGVVSVDGAQTLTRTAVTCLPAVLPLKETSLSSPLLPVRVLPEKAPRAAGLSSPWRVRLLPAKALRRGAKAFISALLEKSDDDPDVFKEG